MTNNANDTTKDQARFALYRKYLRVCEGMTQDQAREECDKGCPFSTEELNTAILKKHKLNASQSSYKK